jgi:Protein of unknown function (DUF2950)
MLIAASPRLCFARHSGPQRFSSPEEASHALFAAAKNDDDRALMQVLGAGRELVSLEDKTQDKLEREQFLTKYQEMHRLVREPDQTTVLYIGAENWPFPVPLVSRNGTWSFDAKTGMREVLFRRIGENETKALDACRALAAAKRGSKTTLTGEKTDKPISTLIANQTNDGSTNQHGETFRYHGYYFRILGDRENDAAGGASSDLSSDKTTFIVAYPIEYRKSGVMTFIVSGDDVGYQKDLGPNTAKLAEAIATYKPNRTWHPAE